MDLKDQIVDSLTPNFIENLYSEVSKKKRGINGEFMGSCPSSNHEDKSASFSFNVNKKGVYKCHVCGDSVSGDIFNYVQEFKGCDSFEDALSFLADKLSINKDDTKKAKTKSKKDEKEEWEPEKEDRAIPVQTIMAAVAILRSEENSEAFKALIDIGITEEIITKYFIGYKNGRYWFPVKNNKGEFVNVRRYMMDAKSKRVPKMMSYPVDADGYGYGESRMFPLRSLKSDEVYIFEGEKDMFIALSKGLNAITSGGVTSWKKDWGALFLNKSVVICMDADKEGIEGAKKRVADIFPFCKQLKVINLPFENITKDCNDFADYLELYSFSDFVKLVAETPVYKEVTTEDVTEYKVNINEASKPVYANKRCFSKGTIVTAKDDTMWTVPAELELSCDFNDHRTPGCKTCILKDLGSLPLQKRIEKTDPLLLELFKVSSTVKTGSLKRHFGVKAKCGAFKTKLISAYKVESLELQVDLSYNKTSVEPQCKNYGYYVWENKFDRMFPNKTYNIKSLSTADPKTQNSVHQIYLAELAETNIDTFKVTKETAENLKRFQPKEGQSIEDKIGDIYDEFSNRAGLYGRQDMFLLMDLVFHSALSFSFQNKILRKGWVEAAIVGDSGTAKSAMANFLCDTYRVGDFVGGENLSFAGLVGGLTQMGTNWNIHWGRIPLNDRRMCVIDETSGMLVEQIARLSEIRSSGIAKIEKIKTEQTMARTRLLWLSNPRKKGFGVTTFDKGVKAIPDVFGQPEDVRRLDLALCVASEEVSATMANSSPKAVDDYYGEMNHDLVMFIWSRTPEQIIVPDDVQSHIRKWVISIDGIYSDTIPLIETSVFREKLVRMSVALAGRLFSVDFKGRIIVKKEHVDYIMKYLKRIYSNERFQYEQYSREKLRAHNLLNTDRICEIFDLDDEFVIADLSRGTINKGAIDECFRDGVLSLTTKAKVINELRRLNAIDDRTNYYIIQPGFRAFLNKKLKKIQDNGGIGDMPV